MKTTEFDYDLPEQQIGQFGQKLQSRLLVADAESSVICDNQFSQLSSELNRVFKLPERNARLLLIVNETLVYKARFKVTMREQIKGEVFILSLIADNSGYFTCLLRPQKKMKIHEILSVGGQPVFRVESLEPPLVSCLAGGIEQCLEQYGDVPLPPYIHRPANKDDEIQYQTVYGKHIGSAAAPTAGLHFTQQQLDAFPGENIDTASVTLHIGLGTFKPVQTQEIQDHQMHEEQAFVPSSTFDSILEHKQKGWPIVYVGTTSFRTIESLLRFKHATDTWFKTDLFVRPSDKFDKFTPQVGNALLTNFHQPKSTLTMLVAALCGYHFWAQIYAHALNQQYRFLSYGDSSLLIFRKER